MAVMLFRVLPTAAHADPAAAMWVWFAANLRIDAAIVWQDPVTAVEQSRPAWTAEQNDSLTVAYNMLATSDSAGLGETSVVTLIMSGANVDRLAWDTPTAWSYYVAFVAQSLLVEIDSRVSWSIVGYSDRELAMLFHSRSLFYLDTAVDSRPLMRSYITEAYPAPAGSNTPWMDGPTSISRAIRAEIRLGYRSHRRHDAPDR